MKKLLAHRLISRETAPPSMATEEIRRAAKSEWIEILEGIDVDSPRQTNTGRRYQHHIEIRYDHF